MTTEQYERWKDFAIRMAKTCFRGRRRPTSAWILKVVEDWFESFDPHDICAVVDWDCSEAYPEGHPYYRKTYRCLCWHCSRVGNDPNDCRYNCEDGKIYDYAKALPVCDLIASFLDGWKGWSPRCPACRDYDSERDCTCHDVEEMFHDQWDDKWGGPVRCCIRAGLDMAASPSAGVIGFTAGDLRRMYPEGVPEWCFGKTERLQYWPNGELNGVFDDLPDEAGVVL